MSLSGLMGWRAAYVGARRMPPLWQTGVASWDPGDLVFAPDCYPRFLVPVSEADLCFFLVEPPLVGQRVYHFCGLGSDSPLLGSVIDVSHGIVRLVFDDYVFVEGNLVREARVRFDSLALAGDSFIISGEFGHG